MYSGQGCRLSCALLWLFMTDWTKHVRQKLEDAGLDILLLSFYVDDNQQATTRLPMEVRFVDQTGKF